MKHIPETQDTSESQDSTAVDTDQPQTSVGASPMENAKKKSSTEVDFDATVPGEVETDATGKNILIRDKDASDDTSELTLLEDSPPENSETDQPGESDETSDADEYDPYNSGTFDMSNSRLSKSRSWKSRSRK